MSITSPLPIDDVLPALTAALDSNWLDARYSAAEALGGFGARAKSALPRLRALEKADQWPWVQKAAGSAALRIEEPPVNETPP